MKRKFKFWIHRYIKAPLVSLLVQWGITRNARLWKIVYFLSAKTAGLCILMEDSQRPDNTLYWYWQEGELERNPESVAATLVDIDEMISRAPVPFGGDDFIIRARKFAARLDEHACFNFDQDEDVDKFVKSHPLIGAWNLRGNRWRDWKKGDAKVRLYDILLKAEPTRSAPLTLICVIVVGRAIARAILAAQGKAPSF